MKLYIAADDQTAARHAAALCRRDGHTIVSTWLNQPFNRTAEHTVDERQALADRDVDEVLAADALVLLAGPEKCPGGKFVEAGIAIGCGSEVHVVGRIENMLLWSTAARHHASVEAMLEDMRDAAAALEDE